MSPIWSHEWMVRYVLRKSVFLALVVPFAFPLFWLFGRSDNEIGKALCMLGVFATAVLMHKTLIKLAKRSRFALWIIKD